MRSSRGPVSPRGTVGPMSSAISASSRWYRARTAARSAGVRREWACFGILGRRSGVTGARDYTTFARQGEWGESTASRAAGAPAAKKKAASPALEGHSNAAIAFSEGLPRRFAAAGHALWYCVPVISTGRRGFRRRCYRASC